jgi:hypothetical protein
MCKRLATLRLRSRGCPGSAAGGLGESVHKLL